MSQDERDDALQEAVHPIAELLTCKRCGAAATNSCHQGGGGVHHERWIDAEKWLVDYLFDADKDNLLKKIGEDERLLAQVDKNNGKT